MAVPYTFGSATSSIPLSQLDSNFATAITLGNTAVYLGNTTTTLNALTLSNVTISSGNVTITSVTLANANITGTTTLSGLTASTALALDASKNIVSVTNTGTGNNVLAASPSLTGTVTIATLNLTNALGTTYGGTGLTSFTANGVVYASSSSALATGSALTFNGTNFATTASNFDLNPASSAPNISLREGNTYRAYLEGNSSGLVFGIGASATEQMRLTSTGLGIGTSSPSYKLQVNGSSTGDLVQFTDGTYQSIRFGTSTTGFYYNNPNGGYQAWNISGSEKMRLDSSGNLGLGVTPSVAGAGKTFEIGTAVGNLIRAAGQNDMNVESNTIYNSGFKYANNGFANRFGVGAATGQFQWFTAPSGTAGNAVTFTQAMTLDASGNLGVGTTSISSKLYVAGGTNDGLLRVGNTNAVGTQYISIYANGAEAYYNSVNTQNSVYGSHIWNAQNNAGTVERARIDSSGNLIVGTTSSSFNERIASINSSSYTYGSYRSGTGSEGHIIFVNGNGAVGSIFTNGSVTLFNTTSDQRLKENIQDADSSSSLIDALQVRKFDWKANGSHQRYGFVAQELLTVAPEAVNQPEDTEQMMAVDYSKLVPMLVKEIQSLRKRLADAGIA